MRPGVGIRDWGFVKGNGKAHASANPDCVKDRRAIGILDERRGGAGRRLCQSRIPISHSRPQCVKMPRFPKLGSADATHPG